MPRYSLFFKLAIVIIAFLGLLDTSYMTWSELSGIVPSCQPPFDCGRVLSSPWSHVGPVPLSAIGIVYYATILTVAILVFLDASERAQDFLLVLTTGGFLFSLYLVFVMAFVLNAWCLYCVGSALSSFLLFSICIPLFLTVRKRNLFHFFYVQICKPIFFLLDAEFVHNRMTEIGIFLGKFSITRFLTKILFYFSHPKLSKKIAGISFPNPVGLSAGFDYDGQLTDILPSVGFGFATIGTVTLEPYGGNTKPRLSRFPRSQALLVNKGFKSSGAKVIIARLSNKNFTIPIGISIGSTNKKYTTLMTQIDDILQTFYLFEQSNVRHSYYELNISCPNLSGGQPFTTGDRLERLLSRLDKLKSKKPVFIKMPIDLSDTETLLLLTTAAHHQIAGVVFGNLTKDKNNPDVNVQDRALWKDRAGNVSGKPTWNRSNHAIILTKKHFKERFVIIGTGGIFSPQDATEKMKLGANLVQLITGMIYEGPQLIGEINQYLTYKTVDNGKGTMYESK
ncbi:MAG: quinone-dependent dihydroorotate dehydrogenase [Candidatus Woesebacteria bacterium]